MGLDRIVIVGASLAGLRAAEELRTLGHDGTITLVGDEPHRPYDRPPLSKQVLAGTKPPESTELSRRQRARLTTSTSTGGSGQSATGLDLAERTVLLGGGERLRFDGLVIATGASPEAAARHRPPRRRAHAAHARRLPGDPRRARRVTAAGWRWSAPASSAPRWRPPAAASAIDVSLIEALPVPLERGLGPEMGAVVADVHRDHGVDVRLGVGVVLIEGGDRVERIRLTDGTVLDVDLVVVGIGVAPNTDWLEGSGLTIDNGVVCDATCTAAPGVVAAGDVARWPNHALRRGHARRALGQRHRDGHPRRPTSLLAGDAAEPFAPIPWFWSDQYDRKIQLAGRAGAGRRRRGRVRDRVEERRFVAFYGRDGRVVGRARHEPARQGHALAVAGRGRRERRGRGAWPTAAAAE